jgi:endo-1,4-beta-D-glucanase Y
VTDSKTEIAPEAWRLRVYAGRRASGTPIQIRKMVEYLKPVRKETEDAGNSQADT